MSSMILNDSLAYLLGLLCARGHIYPASKRIVIEFAHKNKTIEGIAYCPKCGEMATSPSGKDYLMCKNKSCQAIVDKSVKPVYEQQESTIVSLKEIIIPFLNKNINANYDLIGNDHITCLIIDFQDNETLFNEILETMNNKFGFDSFEIPAIIYSTSIELKKEFINGLLDAAGFFNSGGWYPRNGQNSSARMRAHFQIVRNWNMPVQICNFLKSEFKLPIQTIDWGHPNIRDGAMKDYFESNTSSWSREHQVKFLPEYYIDYFKLRLTHKQKMFEELATHNKNAIFDSDEDCNAPTTITKKQLKVYHKEENSKKIPECTRTHCDAFWQVCANMGCKYAVAELNGNKNYYSTGIKNCLNASEVLKNFDSIRKFITAKSIESGIKLIEKKETKERTIIRTNPEQQLYKPMCLYLEKFLSEKYKQEVVVHDTSAFYLDKFIVQKGLEQEFEFCDNFKIKPDIVGFLRASKKLIFVEVKDEELTIQSIGQLLGYCLVAQPEEAILVSPKEPNMALKMLLTADSSFLQYGRDLRIKIATWVDNKFKYLEY